MFNLIISNNDDEIHNDEIKNVSIIFFKMHILVQFNEKKIFFEILLTRKRKTTMRSIILTTTKFAIENIEILKIE